MRLGRPTPGIGHARGMKPICVEHRRACNFASLSFPCFVDSLRTRACMHACMHACADVVATVVICFARERRYVASLFFISLFFSPICPYIYIEEKRRGLVRISVNWRFFFDRREKM